MTDASFLDLDRIEVLKGPQALFWQQRGCRALNIVTKKPGDAFDASARALYGMFGQYALKGNHLADQRPAIGTGRGNSNGMRGWQTISTPESMIPTS